MSPRIRFWSLAGGLAPALFVLAPACQGSSSRPAAEPAPAEAHACGAASDEAGMSSLICEDAAASPPRLSFSAPRPRPPEDPASTRPAAPSPISRQPLRGGGR